MTLKLPNENAIITNNVIFCKNPQRREAAAQKRYG
jgi:hypothetical protein